MIRVSRFGTLRALIPVLGLGLCGFAGCATPIYRAADGMLWHPSQRVGIPDLAAEGWTRTSAKDADLAFSRHGAGIFAVRVRCPAPEESVPLRWESRGLWLGVPRDRVERRPAQIDGHKGMTMHGVFEELALRTLVVRTDDCSLDVAQVAPSGTDGEVLFDAFISRVRLTKGTP